MSILKRLAPSPSLVIACLALLLVLGGTSFAASRLPRNSVTTVQVKNHSLLARDFKAGQLPRGPVGPVGPSGASSIKWALVRPDGGIAAQSGGITLAAKPSAGTYILRIGSTVTGKPIIASAGYAGDSTGGRGETSAGPCGGGSQGRTCPTSNNTSTIFVQARNNSGALADHSFYVAVFG
jgi:hypothetical protein